MCYPTIYGVTFSEDKNLFIIRVKKIDLVTCILMRTTMQRGGEKHDYARSYEFNEKCRNAA